MMSDMWTLRVNFSNHASFVSCRLGHGVMLGGLVAFGLVGGCGGKTGYIFSEDGTAPTTGSTRTTSSGSSGATTSSSSTSGDGDGDEYMTGDGDGDGDGDWSTGPGNYDYYDGPWYGPPGYYGGPWYGGGSGGGLRPVVDEPLVGCSVQNQNAYGPNECYANYSCENGELWSYCWNGGDQIYCDCEAGRGWASLVLEPGTDDPCGVVADFCAMGDVSGFEEPVCMPQWQDASSDYCSIEASCTSYADHEGNSIGWSEYQSTWCHDEGGDWMCQCSGNGANLSLSFSPSSGGLDACTEGRDICDKATEFSGPLECDTEYQTASNDWCDVGLRCSQRAEVDGTVVSLNAWANAWCDGYDGDQWQCYCNGFKTSEGFAVNGNDPWDSCVQAGDICADMIEKASAN